MELQFTLEQIAEAAAICWNAGGDAKVFAFHGDLGAGKTTFIHALCSYLGVTSAVSSPTFSIINQYDYPGGLIYHIDLYRLADAEEAQRAGVEEVLFSGDPCFAEWPERAPELFPTGTVHVYLSALDERTRRVLIDDK